MQLRNKKLIDKNKIIDIQNKIKNAIEKQKIN